MREKRINSARTPVYRDTGFELYDASNAEKTFTEEADHNRDPDLFIYSRYRNPTVVAAEEEVMKAERSGWAILTQSGMSAIDTALSIFQQGKSSRPWLFFSEIYGGTISYIESVLKARRGIEIIYFHPENGQYNLDELENLVNRCNPEIIYAETISNPLLIVADIERICSIGRKMGSKVIVDNTFATPWLFRPLEHGAEIVIHSATKYFSGHGNLTAGIVCGNTLSVMQQAIEYRKYVGHMISPDDAYRLTTQMKTFRLRFEQQCANAKRLAELLCGSSAVGKVLFPGLQEHLTHDVAKRILAGGCYGAMVTVDFTGSSAEEKRRKRDSFIRGVSDHIKLIPTLGDPLTILLPVESVWGKKYPEPGMVRLSAGFEDWDLLRESVEKALTSL